MWRQWTHGPTSIMQLLYERALLIHFSVTLSSAILDFCPWDSGPMVLHPLCSCFMRELRSYTLVLLSALRTWISVHETLSMRQWTHGPTSIMQLPYERASLIHFSVTLSSANLDFCPWDSGPMVLHPSCSCFMRELCSYTLVLLSALRIWISVHETLSMRQWTHGPTSIMQLLYGRASLIHFSVTLSSAISDFCPWDSGPMVLHPSCSYLMRELRSYTLVLLSALRIWTHGPTSIMQLFYGRASHFSDTLTSAILDFCPRDSGPMVLHPSCSCSVRGLCSYTLVLLLALQIWMFVWETVDLRSDIYYAVALWESYARTL